MTALAGTSVLVRLALRHDRVRLSAWILGLCVFLAGTAAGRVGAMTREDLIQETEFTAGSPALRVFGLASGATSGGYTMLRDYLTLAILAAVMSTLTVVRHTRTEEETGRSGPGRPPGQLAAATETSLAQLPAILVIGACVIAVIGLLPRWAGTLSWTIVALSILLGPLFGPTVDLPQWAQDLSPFTHIPKVPAAALTVTPIVALTAIAAALALAGVSSFRRRNLALPT